VKDKKIAKLNKCLDQTSDRLSAACKALDEHIQGNGNSKALKEKSKKIAEKVTKSS